MSYKIKEIYYTLQGEGFHSGRAAVFCRFSGCNLWSGREEDRAGAICDFCDTDFVGTGGAQGGRYSGAQLVDAISKVWKGNSQNVFVVFTGGEPLLQLDEDLINICHESNFEVAVETNGTIAVPKQIDWICVSPKQGSELVQKAGQELKLVYPQLDFLPDMFEDLNFEHFYLQPMDGPNIVKNVEEVVEYCLKNPLWKLSLQSHKYIGIK